MNIDIFKHMPGGMGIYQSRVLAVTITPLITTKTHLTREYETLEAQISDIKEKAAVDNLYQQVNLYQVLKIYQQSKPTR
jgi:hypothetical protein